MLSVDPVYWFYSTSLKNPKCPLLNDRFFSAFHIETLEVAEYNSVCVGRNKLSQI